MNKSATNLASQTASAVEIIYELVARQRYGVEYQPIICARSGDILAYEALARFYTYGDESIPPLQVFEYLHMDPPVLRQVEQEIKCLQIDYAPAGYDLFINIDPHALELDTLSSSPLIQQLHRRDNIVVELIENSDIHEARAAVALHKLLQENGINTALDDIGASHALLSLEILSLVDYLKFDRCWTHKLNTPVYASMFRSLLNFATQSGKQTVLEGIETEAMRDTARTYGIDRLQGFLYRPLFINKRT